MRTATIREAKAQLDELLQEVRQGESVELTDAGHVVARLVPPAGEPERLPDSEEDDAQEAWLADLEARGIISRPKASRAEREAALKWLLEHPLPDGDSGVLAALLEERREGH